MTTPLTRGILYVVSAPSGAGKTSLVRALCDSNERIRVSISFTTRQPRPGEENGRDYHFVDAREFRRRIDAGDFIEHACVFDQYYGTSRVAVMEQLQRGLDVILEIDWQGAQQVRRSMPECVSIFILPPSPETLEQRLRSRNQDSDEQILRRLGEAKEEMSHYREYDYLIVNDDFSTALQELQTVIRGGHLRCATQRDRYRDLLARLLA